MRSIVLVYISIAVAFSDAAFSETFFRVFGVDSAKGETSNQECVLNVGAGIDITGLQNIYNENDVVNLKCADSMMSPYPTNECVCKNGSFDCMFVMCLNGNLKSFKIPVTQYRDYYVVHYKNSNLLQLSHFEIDGIEDGELYKCPLALVFNKLYFLDDRVEFYSTIGAFKKFAEYVNRNHSKYIYQQLANEFILRIYTKNQLYADSVTVFIYDTGTEMAPRFPTIPQTTRDVPLQLSNRTFVNYYCDDGLPMVFKSGRQSIPSIEMSSFAWIPFNLPSCDRRAKTTSTTPTYFKPSYVALASVVIIMFFISIIMTYVTSGRILGALKNVKIATHVVPQSNAVV